MPICWRNDHLILKIVPQPEGEDEQDFKESLIRWDPMENTVTAFPHPSLSNSAHISVESARLSSVFTEICFKPQSEDENELPTILVKLQTYDFWNL